MTHPAMRAYGAWAATYRRTWRGEVARSFLTPALYLGAMGVGLGSYVRNNGGQAQLGGHSYVAYIAPGLLAATAMQTAAGESTWPVLGSIKWWKRYQAMLATPLRVRDVMLGHVAWMATWLAVVCGVFLCVMAGFGVLAHPTAALLLPAAVLTGMAFATPIAAYAATCESDTGFSMLFRFGVVPMFLFSGTFFPIAQLPVGLRPVAYVTPLWHGVDLCRSIDLGTGSAWLTVGHVAYLLAWVTVGLLVAQRTYARRLRV